MAKAKAKAAEITAAEPQVEEVKAEVIEGDLKPTFIERKLKVINEMSDRAKAQRLAERVLMNNTRKG